MGRARAYRGAMTPDATLDTCGLICPLPVLKLRKRLQTLAPGQIIEMQADDPVAIIDIPNYCQEAGHELLSARTGGDVQIYLLRKGPAQSLPRSEPMPEE